ncbi:MAG: FG-GAP-like repeat-containing protein [Chloroflexota bacterium]
MFKNSPNSLLTHLINIFLLTVLVMLVSHRFPKSLYAQTLAVSEGNWHPSAQRLLADGKAHEIFGWFTGSVGDVNGDGFDDLGIHALGDMQFRPGRSLIHFGSADGISETADWVVGGTDWEPEEGEPETSEQLVMGFSLFGVRDLNDDGFDDVAIPVQVQEISTRLQKSEIWLYAGGPDGPSAEPDWTISLEPATLTWVYHVAPAGDVDHDGYPELLVVGFGEEGSQVTAELYAGGRNSPGHKPIWRQSYPASKWSVARFVPVGDLDHDGYADLLVSHPTTSSKLGAAQIALYAGSADGLEGELTWIENGTTEGGYLGYSMDLAGDVNGDGFHDVAASEMDLSSGVGRVMIYYGSEDGLDVQNPQLLEQARPESAFGIIVSHAGDVNNDGYADLMVGSFTDLDNGNFIWELYLGGQDGLSSNVVFTQPVALRDPFFLNMQRVNPGDLNGDGFSDLALSLILNKSDLLSVYAVLLTYGGDDAAEANGDFCYEPDLYQQLVAVAHKAVQVQFDRFAPFETTTSPSGTYNIEIRAGEPFGFGANPMAVFGRSLSDSSDRNSGLLQPLLRFRIANDGMRIDASNCANEWSTQGGDELIEVTCDGDEQAAESYTINVTAAMQTPILGDLPICGNAERTETFDHGTRPTTSPAATTRNPKATSTQRATATATEAKPTATRTPTSTRTASPTAKSTSTRITTPTKVASRPTPTPSPASASATDSALSGTSSNPKIEPALSEVPDSVNAANITSLVELKPYEAMRLGRGRIYQVVLASDQNRVAVATGIGIWIYEMEQSGTQRLIERQSPVYSVEWSSDGTQLLVGSGDGTVKILDADSGEELTVFEGHTESVGAAVWSPDGSRILSGSTDQTVKLWDATNGEELQTFSGHSESVYAVDWSPDGTQALSGSRDKTVKIWNVESGEALASLSDHSDRVFSVAWSPNGTRILSGSRDETAIVWDAVSYEKLFTLSGHTDDVNEVNWNDDGTQILTASDDAALRIWDATNGEELAVLTGHDSFILSAAWSIDGQHIISGGDDTTLRVWDTESGEVLTTLFGHSSYGIMAAYSPDRTRILSSSGDNRFRVWDAASGALLSALPSVGSSIDAMAWSPDGTQILFSTAEYEIKIWDLVTSEEVRTFVGHTDNIYSVAWNPGGAQVLSGSWDETVRVWDVQRGEQLLTFPDHGDWVNTASWSPDGSRILTGGADSTIKVREAETGDVLLTLTHIDWVLAAAWSPDGTQILSSGYDNVLKIWDAETGQEIATFTGHSDRINAVAWSPDGTQILSVSDDKTIKVWNAKEGGAPLTLSGHTRRVNSVSWHPAGRAILTGSSDGTVRVWTVDQAADPGAQKQTIAAPDSNRDNATEGVSSSSTSNTEQTDSIWQPSSIMSITHEENEEWITWRTGSVGDVNGDGFDDLGVHYLGSNWKERRMLSRIYFGSTQGIAPDDFWQAGGIDWEKTLDGHQVYSTSLFGIGDLNDDGFDEVVNPILYADDPTRSELWIYFGSRRGPRRWPEGRYQLGTISEEPLLVEQVRTVDDLNGDGFSDILVRAGHPQKPGIYTWLFYGSGEGLTPAQFCCQNDASPKERLVQAWPIGDISEDGYADLLAGVWLSNGSNDDSIGDGQFWVVTGSADGLATQAVHQDGEALTLPSPQHFRGYTDVGDVTGDGFDDFAFSMLDPRRGVQGIGLHLGNQNGFASKLQRPIRHANPDDKRAGVIVGVGDVNGDGYGDIYALSHDPDAQSSWWTLYLGSSDGLSSEPAFTHQLWPGQRLLTDHRYITSGDFNGDGLADVAFELREVDRENDNEVLRDEVVIYYGNQLGGK